MTSLCIEKQDKKVKIPIFYVKGIDLIIIVQIIMHQIKKLYLTKRAQSYVLFVWK